MSEACLFFDNAKFQNNSEIFMLINTNLWLELKFKGKS